MRSPRALRAALYSLQFLTRYWVLYLGLTWLDLRLGMIVSLWCNWVTESSLKPDAGSRPIHATTPRGAARFLWAGGVVNFLRRRRWWGCGVEVEHRKTRPHFH